MVVGVRPIRGEKAESLVSEMVKWCKWTESYSIQSSHQDLGRHLTRGLQSL